jgi:hypothetical protein
MRQLLLVSCLLPFLALTGAAAGEGFQLVACAPGYPGNTEQAQPTMDGFAAALTQRSGWEAGRLSAVYHEKEEAGLAALAASRAALAMVPLPFYLEHREELGLEPLLEVLPASGEAESWSLVAKKGTIRDPANLSGWDLAGIPGYAPRFVRRVALGGWGGLPEDVRIRFSSRVLSDLRKAAAGEPVAVLLDGAQADALASLPFAAELEVVARSPLLAGNLLCQVGGRLPEKAEAELRRVLLALETDETGREVLASLRIAGFREADTQALEEVCTLFAGGEAP